MIVAEIADVHMPVLRIEVNGMRVGFVLPMRVRAGAVKRRDERCRSNEPSAATLVRLTSPEL